MFFKSKNFPNISEHNNIISINLFDFCSVTQLQQNDVPNFVKNFEPIIQEIIEYYDDLKYITIKLEHSFESIPLIIEGKHFFHQVHELCQKYSIDPAVFEYCTGNWRIHELYSSWKSDNFPTENAMRMTCVMSLQRLYAPNIEQIPNKLGQQTDIGHMPHYRADLRPYVYNCLNRAPHIHRLHVFEQLAKNDLLQHGLVSANEVGGDGAFGFFGKISDEVAELLPYKLDVPQDASAINYIYQDAMPQAFQEIESKTYDQIPNAFENIFFDSMVSVVTETNMGVPVHKSQSCDDCGAFVLPTQDNMGECCVCSAPKQLPDWFKWHQHGFITEKTWRCMLNRHPVLWISAPNTAKTMQRLGFCTFDSVWSEHYDTIQNPITRINAVIDILKQLRDMNNQQQIDLMQTLRPILDHNYRVITALKYPQKLTKLVDNN